MMLRVEKPPVPSRGATEAPTPAQAGLLARLLGRRVAAMLARNTFVSCLVFAFDLALLWVLVRFWGVQYLVAATLAFIVAISIHYGFARAWIFPGSERAHGSGYVYFIVNAGIGLVITIALYAAFVELLGIHYIVARVIVSIFAGLAVFLLNAVLNFRSV
jgi:putative flippase GtrA